MTGQSVGLPPVIFLFTTDQLASMLNISETHLMNTYLYYAGRSSGIKASHQMDAVNIAPADERPDWRVNVSEFVRWCKRRGIKIQTMTHFA